MQRFSNADGIQILNNLIQVIKENKQYLSDIDGLIGDGDHGINMNKGFTLCEQELKEQPGDFAHGLNLLSRVLMMKIGGSMGPLYGKLFKALAKTLHGKEYIEREDFGLALQAAIDAIETISQAKIGDKTLMDCLIPAVSCYKSSIDTGSEFTVALDAMKVAAIAGRDSTKEIEAKLGRASRLGERSKGVIDAGSASCCLILCTMADTIKELV